MHNSNKGIVHYVGNLKKSTRNQNHKNGCGGPRKCPFITLVSSSYCLLLLLDCNSALSMFLNGYISCILST